MTAKNLIKNHVRVTVPQDREDELTALRIPMSDVEGRRNASKLRKAFNASVRDSLKEYAVVRNLESEVDFTGSAVNNFGFTVLCTETFGKIVLAEQVPHIGGFLKDGPL